eukprot:8308325-Prorocentrum_lima.AAC.1
MPSAAMTVDTASVAANTVGSAPMQTWEEDRDNATATEEWDVLGNEEQYYSTEEEDYHNPYARWEW